MESNIVILNKEAHKTMKVKQDKTFSHAKNKHISVLQVHEIVSAAACYPVVFVKDAETGAFRVVAMLGLAPQENLFYSADGWSTSYIPTSLMGYPFLISSDSLVCVDTNNDLVNEREGNSLFNDDGSESAYLNDVKELLGTFNSQAPTTKAFIDYVAEKKLLSPLNLTIRVSDKNDGAYGLNGVYAIDNKVLHELSDSDFLELQRKNYLFPIFSHLTSLGIISTLVQKKSRLQK